MTMDASKVVCFKCSGIEIEIENLGIDPFTLENMPECLQGAANCVLCGKRLTTGEPYFEDEETMTEFREQAFSKMGEVISQRIDACGHCSDAMSMEYYIYSYNKDEDSEDRMEEVGTDFYDLLLEYGIREELHDAVLEHIVCPKCGYGREPYHPKHNPYGGHFSFDDKVYTHNEVEQFWGHDLIDFADSYGVTISQEELVDFKEFLYKYPMLGSKHPVGDKIHQLVARYMDSDDYTILEIGTPIYRGRKRKVDEPEYQISQLLSPPEGIASHGRYNSVGVSVFYCTSDLKGIPLELHPSVDELIDIGEFTILENSKMLCIDRMSVEFEGFVDLPNRESKLIKKQYLIPNFIGACAAQIGFDGIEYKGVGNGTYTNYALFNAELGKKIKLIRKLNQSYKVTYSPN